MLVNLHVKNLAIIDEIEIDFRKHLNILTGETGAGKSIIIGSINIALGGKVPQDMIRKGADYGLVELVFQVSGSAIEEFMNRHDLEMEDGQIILSRKIMRGRSVCKINGETVPVSVIRELSGYLIDIHGQQEHQSLLYKAKHLSILDHYAKQELLPYKSKTGKLYSSYQALKEELNSSGTSEEERLREMSFLEYEMNEIEAAALKEGEEEELEEQYRKMVNMGDIMEGLSSVYGLTSSSQESVSSLLGRAARILSKIQDMDSGVENFAQQIETIDNFVNDLNLELFHSMNNLNYDEEECKRIEERLDTIRRMKAKYGNSYEKILEYYEKAQLKLQKYQKFEEYQAELLLKLKHVEEELEECCKSISSIRKAYAGKLEKDIYEALVELNFLDVRFQINFKKMEHYSSNGFDDVEFYISTNPGEDLKPLGKAASGGELSRVMLAVKSVLADNDMVETLIFDEIDVGVSGRTAQKVSERLSYISRKHQVICITHLPQIAAMADSHYIIEKMVKGTVTVTNIRCLDEEDSVKELARILGGAAITDKVMESAREMKDLASKSKNY
ncbi:DNA repair protein RecN [[Clostridium] polysaccharolyticum]|uniref:DNA repair protein RecN n=1 Tax=[Clostridium] polysaccharolyticum TaxID=29364 RepID=A0A1I0BAR1_9FIRM|nr:DNA repair protein RecN [[Clostridium] polysaccharolyticum]SET03897.1 DNA replication and repair protein RecN [[Clostridium] polysaccharolyticum]